jgi:D-alanyl-D-alanine carboxypeptidase
MMKFGCVPAGARRLGAIGGVMIVAASVVVSSASPAEARRRAARGGGYNPPYADMVVDAKTGKVLHAVNEHALRHPASVTKVMTLYLLFEQLERGKMALDTELKVSAHGASQPPSKLGVRPGGTIEVEDAIKALVTKSANDVAATIGENIAGSEDAFAEMMTRKARALGMTRTVFRNASGLPDPEQVTTAHDLTLLGRAIQERFPRYYSYFQTRSFRYGNRTIGNHNRLLGRIEGVDGIKTGFTRASGFNLLTSARTGGRHVVAAVLGGRSGAVRDRIMANLVTAALPRAYAGAATAPVIAEAAPAERSRPVVAEAPRPAARPDVETTATTTPAKPARGPLELAGMRPVVASAAGAASTTTPSSLGWRTGPQAVPQAAQGYAALESDSRFAPSASPTAPAPLLGSKLDVRLPETVITKAPEPRVADAPQPQARPQPARAEIVTRPPVSAWVIQLGAMDDEDKAKSMLDEAKSRSGRALAHAAPFTEKVVRDGATLYRARFSGFQEPDSAQEACKTLKRSGFNCFATRS